MRSAALIDVCLSSLSSKSKVIVKRLLDVTYRSHRIAHPNTRLSDFNRLDSWRAVCFVAPPTQWGKGHQGVCNKYGKVRQIDHWAIQRQVHINRRDQWPEDALLSYVKKVPPRLTRDSELPPIHTMLIRRSRMRKSTNGNSIACVTILV